MPKVTIDGQEIEVAAGTTVLQAALSQGSEIPHYCYHPGLSIAGNCRMCLVEVEKAPKLLIGCATQVADGMVVHTQTDKVKQAHASVMEFLLINHPLDCTICDQAGECRLQEYAVEYGTGKSRYEDPKVQNAKAVDIGRHVMLDQERCIQCSRCTRFCDEVSGTGELAFFQRGERTMIGIYPERRLDNPYSGNVVDICPVGALTLKEFRFQTRVWYLKNTPSVCAGCTRGCNVMVSVGTQQEMMTTSGQFDDRIKRVVPRVNEAVNRHWMCDEGRLSWQRVEAAPRLQAPAWDETLPLAADALKAGRLAALVSPRIVNETLFAWKTLLAALGGAALGVTKIERGADDDLLLRADKGANSRGAAWILGEGSSSGGVLEAVARGDVDTLVVLGDVLDPEDTPTLDASMRSKLKHLVYVGPFADATAEQATLRLSGCAWAEEDGSMVNFEGRVQRVQRAHRPRAAGRPGWRIAADLAATAGVDFPSWHSTAEVFDAIAAEVPAFAGLSEERIGLLGGVSGGST